MSNKADATPPKRYDLPLVDGMVQYNPETESSYAKADDGLVTVHFYCKKEDGSSFSGDTYIAIVPAGFRPLHNVHAAALLSETGDSLYSNQCSVAVCDPNGRIWINNVPIGTKAVTATLVFYSA